MSFSINNRIILILIILFIFSNLVYAVLEIDGSGYSPLLLSITLFVVFVTISLFVKSKQAYSSLRKQYFRISTVFILGYLIVCFQKYIDLLLGYVDSHNSFLFVSPFLINKAAILSLVGLLSFIIGYLFYRPKCLLIKVVNSKIESTKSLNYILFLFVCLFVYYNGVDYLLGSYSQEFLESKQGSIASYTEVIVRSIVFALLILNVQREGIIESFFQFVKSLGWLFHFSLFIYLSLVLISGDRGPIISIASVYLFSYILKVRPKISLIKIAILVFTASLFITFLGIMRTTENELSYLERINIALNDEKLTNDRSVINSTAELASSVRCLHYAMNYVPDRHPFLLGSFQFRDIASIIPASNSLLNTFMDDSFQYTSSAYFITYINQGKYYKYGDGSNIVADLYLSFGITGVVVGLFIFGLIIKKIEIVSFSYDSNKIPNIYYVLVYAYMGFALYISRATIFMPLKYASFTYVVLILFHFFRGTFNKRAKYKLKTQ